MPYTSVVLNRIAEIMSRHKGLLKEWLLPTIVVLVGLTAFGLGRLSVIGEQGPRLLIRLPDGTTQTAAAYAAAAPAKAPLTNGAYVASKSGTKYYSPSCPGAARIKEENKVWFMTVADAEAAGYTAAANCP
jgi:hypothetical protein